MIRSRVSPSQPSCVVPASNVQSDSYVLQRNWNNLSRVLALCVPGRNFVITSRVSPSQPSCVVPASNIQNESHVLQRDWMFLVPNAFIKPFHFSFRNPSNTLTLMTHGDLSRNVSDIPALGYTTYHQVPHLLTALPLSFRKAFKYLPISRSVVFLQTFP